ncbi:MAG TPA: DeoR/GlpR family DNA-binding transcription regulator [Hanamia sp.]
MKISENGMLKNERHAFILKQINLHNKVLSTQLSTQLEVSEDTVRRDLTELAEAGLILKVHGGALSRSYHYAVQQSFVYSQEKKKIIAGKAVKLIKDEMVILTAGGTTMIEMIQLIPDKLEATFFTVSPLMALLLAKRPLITVILLGGEIDHSAQITMGEKTISELSEIKVDLCLLGANGINPKAGLTEVDWRIAQIKKAMINCSSKLAVVTISEKLNSEHKMHLCNVNKIDYLVTELAPEDKMLADFDKNTRIL